MNKRNVIMTFDPVPGSEVHVSIHRGMIHVSPSGGENTMFSTVVMAGESIDGIKNRVRDMEYEYRKDSHATRWTRPPSGVFDILWGASGRWKATEKCAQPRVVLGHAPGVAGSETVERQLRRFLQAGGEDDTEKIRRGEVNDSPNGGKCWEVEV